MDIDRSIEKLGEELRERGITNPGSRVLEWVTVDESPDERDRGILTTADREFLRGNKNYKHVQTESNKREAIRHRVLNSIKDFEYLFWWMDAEQQKRTFGAMTDDELEQYLTYVIGFLYQCVGYNEDRLATFIERGIELGGFWAPTEHDRGLNGIRDVGVSIEIEYNTDIGHLREKYENGRFLRDNEIGLLVRSGELSFREIQELQSS